MRTKEIPQNKWTGFFDSFTRKHEGWLVNVEVFGSDFGAQVQEQQLALEGITDECDETGANTIMIMTGAEPDDHITHTVSSPTQVSLEQTDEGADAALAIKAVDGTTTLLRFRNPMLPELVDALAG
jgi:hypothetical protein